jgi:hypothetical protein
MAVVCASIQGVWTRLSGTAEKLSVSEAYDQSGLAKGSCSRTPMEVSQDSPERFGALSVPVFQGDRLIATLSCAWLPAITNEAAAASTWLGALRQAAQAIGDRARGAHLEPPPHRCAGGRRRGRVAGDAPARTCIA